MDDWIIRNFLKKYQNLKLEIIGEETKIPI